MTNTRQTAPREDDILQAFRLVDSRVGRGDCREELLAFRRRLAGELVFDADEVAATLAPTFELITHAGGTRSVTRCEDLVAGLRHQGTVGGAAMWINLEDLVVDGTLAGQGTLRTLLTAPAASARGIPGVSPEDLCLSETPFAFFVHFTHDLMNSEILYLDAAATRITTLTGAIMPSPDQLREIARRREGQDDSLVGSA